MAIAETGTVIRQIAERYVQQLREHHIPVWRVYLFGSHASGTPHADSDIDLAVFLDQEDINGVREDVALMRLRWDIDLRIEPHAFARTDFDEPDPYVKEIVRTGVRIL